MDLSDFVDAEESWQSAFARFDGGDEYISDLEDN